MTKINRKKRSTLAVLSWSVWDQDWGIS